MRRPSRCRAGARPLAGVKVLDLTRVIAGPVCGRTLAAHGADVLNITAAHLAMMEALVIDTNRGKLSAQLDLRNETSRDTLAALGRQADVFIQGYRPGAIAQYGFSPQEAARLRPGIVYVSLCAYGHAGPWAGRRGFNSLVQNANGLNVAEAEAAGSDKPRPLPTQALDHATGTLMAFGAMIALHRRATRAAPGTCAARWRRPGNGSAISAASRAASPAPIPSLEDVRDRLEEGPSGYGRLTAVRHSAVMSETPARWERPSVPLGTHAPRWD